ncbi:Transcription factor BIM2 [Striga hermonthica]|uniref:Transcription factor BIM2 n=1 Tax=Striga hermonthica TaxID=68872 RepID=A0A9N7N328_STRHE|nr:Transcription factor BIM2 [Striga hermonthica]
MVRSTTQHVEDEEKHHSSSPTEESKRGDSKVNISRSKHSETEQRRRSKINERFQILRDLIPENDQKRDKASFLLEVIQYIQFLQEKLQLYEGNCQGWSPDPAKCLPLRLNPGPLESFLDNSQFDRTFSGDEDKFLDTALVSSAQNSPNMPLQALLLEGSYHDAEQAEHQSWSHFWPRGSCRDDCSVPLYAANKEELRSDSGEVTVSIAHSRGLLNSLKNSLQSSGVDLSKSSISVQLDVGKRTIGRSTNAMFFVRDDEDASCLDYGAPTNISADHEHPQKRYTGVFLNQIYEYSPIGSLCMRLRSKYLVSGLDAVVVA